MVRTVRGRAHRRGSRRRHRHRLSPVDGFAQTGSAANGSSAPRRPIVKPTTRALTTTIRVGRRPQPCPCQPEQWRGGEKLERDRGEMSGEREGEEISM